MNEIVETIITVIIVVEGNSSFMQPRLPGNNAILLSILISTDTDIVLCTKYLNVWMAHFIMSKKNNLLMLSLWILFYNGHVYKIIYRYVPKK